MIIFRKDAKHAKKISINRLLKNAPSTLAFVLSLSKHERKALFFRDVRPHFDCGLTTALSANGVFQQPVNQPESPLRSLRLGGENYYSELP